MHKIITTTNNGKETSINIANTCPNNYATSIAVIVADGDIIGTYYDIDIDDFFKIYDDTIIAKSQKYDNIRYVITNV